MHDLLSLDKLKVYKDHNLNKADFGNFTHNDYQIFLILVTKIGGVDEVGKYLQPENLKLEYELSAYEFSKTFNTDIRSVYKYLKRCVDKLMKTDIKIETPDKITRINICSKAEYNKNKGTIAIKFTEDIMPYLAQVKEKFILYNLKEISNFRSLYTTRLYELLQGFKETGWMLISIQQLRRSFSVGDKFKLYKDLKKRTFGHASQEINKVYDLGLYFEELKQGRKVVAIKFFFNKTKIHKAINPKTGKPMNRYEKPKPKSKTHSSNSSEVIEGQMEFDDLSKNLGKVVQGFADNLKQEKN